MTSDDYDVFDGYEGTSSNIVCGTTAEQSYHLYLEKQKQIADLEYECNLLVDKYHNEMMKARIPLQFREDFVNDMFSNDDKKRREWVRDFFLEQCFSKEFLAKNKVEFIGRGWVGYERTAALVQMAIGDYLYTVEIPIPGNIYDGKIRKHLMGAVKFRVDRLPKVKKDAFCKELEPVQMPTYDWKECFKAIEADVEKQKEG